MAVEYKRDVRLGLSGGSGACSPPLPKWLELRSADVLQRLLKEAQHGGSKVSKHLQLEQIQLQSPRVQLPIGASQAAQSPPCAPIQVESHLAMSPVLRQPGQVASQPTAQTRQRWPPQIQANFSSPKIPLQDQRHAKSMPDASQVRNFVSTWVGHLYTSKTCSCLKKTTHQAYKHVFVCLVGWLVVLFCFVLFCLFILQGRHGEGTH